MEKINITLSVPVERLSDLLCSALEGGSNYWYMIQEKIEPRIWTFEDRAVYSTEAEAKKHANSHYLHCYPFNEGGALMIDDSKADEPELKSPVRLNKVCIYEGLQAWADDAMKGDSDETRSAHPRLFADFIKGDADAETADCFLQYCLFGKVIYS